MKTRKIIFLSAVVVLVLVTGFGLRSSLAQQGAAKPPSDINPESFSRMPWSNPEELPTDEEKQAFDRLAKQAPQLSKRTGPIGPTGTRTLIPVVAESYFNAFTWLTKKTGLEPRYVELAILLATRESGNPYEWLPHEKAAASLMPAASIEAVRSKKDTKGLEEKDSVLIQYGREMYNQPKVSSKTFAEMERLFGEKHTLAVTLLMAHYTANSLMLRAYDQQLPPDQKHPFPNPEK